MNIISGFSYMSRIMNKNFINNISWTVYCLFLFSIIISLSPASATIFSDNGTDLTPTELFNITNETKPVNTTNPVVFFFDPECGSCKPVHEFLLKYISEHHDVKIVMVNLSAEKNGKDMLDSYYLEYKRQLEYVPVVFIGPVGLEGTDDIIAGFKDVYNWYKKGLYMRITG